MLKPKLHKLSPIRANVITAALIGLSTCSCSTLKNSNPDGAPVSIRISSIIQMVNSETGQLINLIDSFNIYYYKDIVLYQIPEFIEFPGSIADSAVSREKPPVSEIRYSFFLFNKHESFGLKYDSVNSLTPSKFNADSLVNEKNFFKQGISMELYTLSESMSFGDDNTILEKYVPKIKKDESFPDSSFLFFNKKLSHVDYYFSRKMDSLKNMKLYKYKIIYNPIPKGKYPFTVPRRVMIFEIKTNPVHNQQYIFDLFEKFKMPVQ